MKDSKNLVIGMLCAVVCVMAVAYAAFSTTLTVNGTANITSEWSVRIATISCSTTPASGGQTLDEPTVGLEEVNGLSAIFSVAFKQPGDSAFCDITVTNAGNLPAILAENGLKYLGGANASTLASAPIIISISAPADTKIAAGATNVWRINASFDQDATAVPSTEQKTKKVAFTLEYIQNLGA